MIPHLFCAFLVGVFTWMALVESGPVRPAAWGVGLASLLLWGAAALATLTPRRDEPVDVRADGSVVVEAPMTMVGLLLAAWLVMLLAVAAWVVVAVTDFSAIENPGFLLVMVIGAVGSLPDLVRLLGGRLHRWRVVADGSWVRYQGYHTDEQLRWTQLAAARFQERPPGVRLERSDGDRAVFVPAIAFTTHPARIADALEKARARAFNTGTA